MILGGGDRREVSFEELARRHGLPPEALDRWRERRRTRGGTADLSDDEVDVLRDVAALLREAEAPPAPAPPRAASPFAVVAQASGTSLMTTREALVAFSHVIEDEARRDLTGAHVFGMFQRSARYEPARPVWSALAAGARSAHVFAAFDTSREARPGRPAEVALAADDPLSLEWLVVVDRPERAMALTAVERPDQQTVPRARRLLDSAWTTDPAVVRRAAATCAQAAAERGVTGAHDVADALQHEPPRPGADTVLAEDLLDALLDALER